MTDKARPTIWLVDVATGPAASAARRLRLLFLAALVARRHAASPMSPPTAAAAALRPLDGERRERAHHRPAGQPGQRSPGRPTAAASPIRCSCPTKAPKLGKAPTKPEGAKWADPLQVIDAVTYRADGAGYLKPGYDQIFWVPADGGAPTQLTFGATNAGGQVSWTAGRPLDPVQRQSVEELGARAARKRDLSRSSIDGGAPVALTDRNGPDNAPVGFARRPPHRLCRLRRPPARLPERPALRHEPRRLGQARAHRLLDRSVGRPGLVRRQPRRLRAGTRTAAPTRSSASASTARSARSRRGLTGGGLDRPYAGGDSASSATARSRSRRAIRCTRPTSALPPASGVRRLTHLNEQLGAKAMARSQKLPVSSSYDKRPIDAWMVTPPDFDPAKKYPLILEIHGGPFAAYGPHFSTDDQLYAAARLCRALYQPARLDLLRRGVRQPDRKGLSRATTMTT